MKKDVKLETNNIERVVCTDVITDEDYLQKRRNGINRTTRVYEYSVNNETVSVKASYVNDHRIYTNIVVDDTKEYVNGYKVVTVSNEKYKVDGEYKTIEYAFLREEDDVLLPYRFDVAGNFDENGYAIVARDGKASFVDKDFNLVSLNEERVSCKDAVASKTPVGFKEVHSFSKGEIPLARVYDDSKILDTNGTTTIFGFAYLDTNMNYKHFYRRRPTTVDDFGYCRFVADRGEDFDQDGFARCNGMILFANGYLMTKEDALNFISKPTTLKWIDEKTKNLHGTTENYRRTKVIILDYKKN